MSESKMNSPEAGDWLERLVRLNEELKAFEGVDPQAVGASSDFQRSCSTAAAAALGIARLRRQRQRLGFLPLPLWEYLGELGKAAGVDLGTIGLNVGSEPAAAGVSLRLARLCHQLGLSVREALLHLGLDLAERVGASPLPVMARQQPGTRRDDTLAAHEESLREALADCGAANEFLALENELRSVYGDRSDGR